MSPDQSQEFEDSNQNIQQQNFPSSKFGKNDWPIDKKDQRKKIGDKYLHIHTRTFPTSHTYLIQNHDLYDYLIPLQTSKARVDIFNLSLNQKYLFFYRVKVGFKQTQCIVIEKSPLKRNYPCYPQGTLLFGAQLKKRDGKYFLKILQVSEIITTNRKSCGYQMPECVYQIVRMTIKKQMQDIKQQGVKLKLGQIIKMGKSQYRVMSLKFGNQKSQIKIANQIQAKSLSPNEQIYRYEPIEPQEGQDESQIICRVCLSGDQPSLVGDDANFLINPCKCKGTAKYIHFQCLQEWMKSRVVRNQAEGAIQFNFKRYECQLCKTPYPKYFQFEGKLIEMVPVTKPMQQHIMFEGINAQSITLLIIQRFENPVRLGRNTSNDIIMPEMTVSRNHSEVVKKADGFYIIDNISKFGTLIMQPQMEIELSEDRRALQVGHSVICFNLAQSEGYLPQPQNAKKYNLKDV